MSGDYQEGRPWMLEGMPTDFDPTITQGSNAVNDAIATQISNECEGQNAWTGDFTRCDPYEESLHDFSSLKVGTINPNNGNTINNTGHGQVINGGQILPCTPQEDCESFNTFYENGSSNETMNNVPGGGVTRLSHYDIENFTDYFGDKNFEEASFDFQDIPQANGGNLIEQTVQSYPEGTEVIIYVKGGPVRVHGTFKGAYTVVTSGWDAVGGNNCLDAGCAGYDGYSTYYRHAWVDSPEFNNTPIDTIPTNIWVTDNLVNVEANGFNCPPGVNGICPPQPTVFDVFTGDIICDFEAPGDCGGSENIMGLVSAANVVVANSPNNRVGGIDLHASVVALNESFVMHYWQNGFIDGCGGGAPYDLFDGGTCVQTPPQSDNRGRAIYNNEPDGRGDLRLWGGIIQKYRGYMNRQAAGPYATNGDIGMDKAYRFDNNLYFPPPGAIKITECESNTIRMSMWDYGMIRP
jgi:hypothetical protein